MSITHYFFSGNLYCWLILNCPLGDAYANVVIDERANQRVAAKRTHGHPNARKDTSFFLKRFSDVKST